MPKKKQISIETIEYMQRTIHDLLSTSMPKNAKRQLCIMMEKLSQDMKQKSDDFQYLHWLKYGRADWEEVKEKHFTNLSTGDTIKIPKEYFVGPDYNDNDDGKFISDIQGEWSRVYY